MRYDEIKGFLHGGDYNAEQWLDRPEILAEDIRLMKEAGVNAVTLGVFSWAMYEPRENEFHFEWLDNLMDSLWENGIHVILATPSGGKPPWLIKKYPHIMRTDQNRIRHLYGERENHCNSNSIYREKVLQIDRLLAERYAHHPALILWHISNEMYGTCHCEDCQQNFRKWLKNKYTTIDKLNQEYWSVFWSHRYDDFDEIESPAPHGETAVHGLALDYQRFYSDLSIDFLKQEIAAVKEYNPQIPVTTNLFHFNCGIDITKLCRILDIVSWDSYPKWHCGTDLQTEWESAVEASFGFDFCRSQKNAPFLLMESTPSNTNNAPVCKLKRPGMHMLSAMQAIASGSDSVQYFQWRKSRGAYEKFHGAVISHNGSAETRVFKDVCAVGRQLQELCDVRGAVTRSRAALIYDWNTMRALEEQKSLRRNQRGLEEIIREHYKALLKNYISIDIIDQTSDFMKYDFIAAPMLYLFLPGTADKIRQFVEKGGTFVLTFYSGLVNENDLAYECMPPYSLNDVFGLSVEETDALTDGEYNTLLYQGKRYKVSHYCDLIHDSSAEMLSAYEKDFYAGMPAVTRNHFGKGAAYYIACRPEEDFLYHFYRDILRSIGIPAIIDSAYVEDVMVKERVQGDTRYQFLMNFAAVPRIIHGIELAGYETKIIKGIMAVRSYNDFHGRVLARLPDVSI